jgi:hypothetical protein
MTLVHFEPKARFAPSDVVLMAQGLRALMVALQPDSWPSSVTEDVWGALRSLYAALGPSPPPVGDIGGPCGRSSSRFQSGLAEGPPSLRQPGRSPQGAFVELATIEVLDHAAALLDASWALQLLGLRLEAFALEGIQGRLLEAAIGAGSVEHAS